MITIAIGSGIFSPHVFSPYRICSILMQNLYPTGGSGVFCSHILTLKSFASYGEKLTQNKNTPFERIHNVTLSAGQLFPYMMQIN